MPGSDWNSYLTGKTDGYNFNYRSEQPAMPPPEQPPLPSPPPSIPSISSKPNTKAPIANKAPVANQLRIPNPPPTKQLTNNTKIQPTMKNIQKLRGGKRKSRRLTKKYRHSRRK